MAFQYTLYVGFQDNRDDILYDGVSYYTSKLIDHLKITYRQIAIDFERSAAIDMENYLFTALNPVRIQLYKAVCYYLAVTGKIPDTDRIWIAWNGQEFTLDKDRLTRHWANCEITYTMDPGVACKCFEKDGKTCYVAITYFLKAQLDLFSHDRFRAAWSGLNALYNHLSEDWHENAKLNALSQYLINNPPVRVQEYIRTLPKSFWKSISWYNYLQNHGLDKTIKDVFITEMYQDKTIYTYLGSCAISRISAEEKKTGKSGRAKLLKDKFDRKRTKKTDRINEQLRFLVIQYCYMLRNRSFHADKPYPIFGLFDEQEDGVESILTTVLLMVIRDTMTDLA